MDFKNVDPAVIKEIFDTVTQVEFVKRELLVENEVLAKFRVPYTGEHIARVSEIDGFTVLADWLNREVSHYRFDFRFEGIPCFNDWVCWGFMFSDNQLSRLRKFSLPTDGVVGRLGYHKKIGPVIAVAVTETDVHVKSLTRGGRWVHKKDAVEWFDGPVYLAFALSEVERLNNLE